jgi:hypothetical protein
MNPEMIDSHHVSKISSSPMMRNFANKICRICFEPESAENPIITPCSCRGSMQHIHERCLKSWILSQNIDPKAFNCDVCKSPVKMEITLKRTCTCKRFRNEMIKMIVIQSIIGITTAVIIFLLVFLINDSTSSALSGKIYIAVAILVCLCIDLAMIIILCRTIKRNCFSRTVKSWKIFSRAVTVAPEVTQVTEFVERKKTRTKSSLVENMEGVKEESFMINTYKTGISFTQRNRIQNFFIDNSLTTRARRQVLK